MQTGATISAVGHAALIVLAVAGLPWFGPRERAPIRVTEVSFISEAEFDAAQSAAPAEAPRAEEAPTVLPAPRPTEAAEAAPEAPQPADAAPDVAEAAPEAPEQAVAVLEPPADLEPGRITPRIVTLDPPTAAAPPSQPAPRVEPNPAPPPEALPPAETPAPATAPEPEGQAVEPEPPAAPPEAAPDPAAEAAPRAPLAPETSGRPLARRAIEPPEPEPPEPELPAPSQADAVMAAVREQARRAAATPPTPAAPATPTEPSAPAATSLPVGPPLTSSEKNGLRLAVQRCWNVPAGLRDAQELKVTLAAQLAPSGDVITASIRLIEPSPAPDGRFQQAFEAGRRALIRCAPYSDLPRDKFAQWRNIEIVFNPEGMVSW